MIRGINHITLSVQDIERSFAFYTHVLGLQPIARWPKGAYLVAGDVWIALVVDAAARTQPLSEYTHIAFTVTADQFAAISQAIHLHFGNMVLCQSFRNPALLAKMAASLQYLSGNRLYLGIGTGWKEDEYRAYGYVFPPPGIRVSQLDEAITIIRALWTHSPASFSGQHYQISDAWCEPKPQRAPPIMIGGKKPRMLRLIARQADWWNIDWATVEECRELLQQMERACTEVGRDPATLRRTWFGWAVCAPTRHEAQAIAGDHTGVIGTPAEVIEQLEPYIELGFDYFMLMSPQFPDGQSIELLNGRLSRRCRPDRIGMQRHNCTRSSHRRSSKACEPTPLSD